MYPRPAKNSNFFNPVSNAKECFCGGSKARSEKVERAGLYLAGALE